MHDIKFIRDNPTAFDEGMARRGLSAMSSSILALDEARRGLIHAAETAQAEANKAAKEIGAAKAAGDEATFERLRAEVAEKKSAIARLQDEAKEKDAELHTLLLGIPNIPYDDVPEGADEDDNVEIRRVGSPRNFAFQPVEHYEIPAVRDQLDFEAGARLSGSRFVVIKGAAARLHRALAQFMIDTHVEDHDLTETQTPVLVREEMMVGTGQLPKFGEDSYQTTNGWWLIPTAEVTLTNLVHGQTVEEAALPMRMAAHTLCFRSEAGSAGRDTSGMLRQHQFEKVEMVTICTPETSGDEHGRMTRCAEAILEKLGLPYRTVVLCTGDMGAGMKKTHDIEVWLPGQNTYREISSVSVAGDYQARRMNARYKPAGGGKPEFVHTLNGSGLAVGRALIAVLENGQEEDGSVTLPEVLHPYLRGKTRISAAGELV
ncbi:serine--tRNA ligase [Ponticoccus sp. SC2-23]|uniref:serine--tRNA ligase n=1 Tax=Alexandriicola marinus TaxID=2081710 RepID=UPI000FDA2046|nr:serine--tRNA ligase [Alexandriicola marinus]MBM1222383.1 serine--tRNA ligase [Ponticoccus sp. SC6-9]MBM1224496.1 serine--tRNA ligase [Ponticoccus sp. SC6-15]MBM1229724.1 serine--tRNA ligase [Ponticoccus sp. SC6-38]MBM1233462.1 serine--tRNA ligase [Ponticoccus sp. SC6-45]MBM1236588.1 serine--tRNA ligase [Ponticoccus sp. SC6-49]MBM1244632.1 serine--tRNA ligase [Ponticoccus sp. SC2-64]MBM1246986.1 serine--tRNA ligase [Ponticoccus sp. SC6-42]MBM1251464.1 serine--tRNA ligase [Ponticoccus sp. 